MSGGGAGVDPKWDQASAADRFQSMRLAFLAIMGTFAASGALAGEAPRGVVELFTSQGCSSCPPADRLAFDLSRDERTLVLTLPVDYWDYLGWKDTLASPANSARQRAYAMTRGDRKVYTPQVVVNGRDAAIGGDRGAIVEAMRRGENEGGMALPVSLKLVDGRAEVTVAAPTRPLAQPHGEVWAFAIERSRSVKIGRGENAGRSATYANVVRHMTRLGSWDGAVAHFDAPLDEIMRPETDAVAVLVQTGSGGQPGAILGAAKADRVPNDPPTATSLLMRQPY